MGILLVKIIKSKFEPTLDAYLFTTLDIRLCYNMYALKII